ncbi:MAG: ABC transporter ATP-binding protein [Spirochaetales bacterium]|nr:ABC transporter ATP-binding protein [Spirochaetales bacterium]
MKTNEHSSNVLQVSELDLCYRTRSMMLPALSGINFSINRGEIVGVVGESGCGKSSLSYAVNGLLPKNGQITNGSISFKGEEVISPDNSSISSLWGNEISMIFQDPMTSLNPVFSIEEQIMTAIQAQVSFNGDSNSEKREKMLKMLERVGIPDAEKHIKKYPHQFSGGMRQRIMIAIALLAQPSLLIADEPTSALDVTLEAQINDLILKLTKEMGTSVLYITHDLGVVAQICDRVMVMYAGQIVENGSVQKIFAEPKHPYTRALLEVHPGRAAGSRRLHTIKGRVPGLNALPEGCRFASRCDYSTEECEKISPAESGDVNNFVRCHNPLSGAVPEAETSNKEQNILENNKEDELIIDAEGVKVQFPINVSLTDRLNGKKPEVLRAVDGIDIKLSQGEVLALVGESGSGKTTAGRCLLRLNDPAEGSINLKGNDITNLKERALRPLRAKVQMIFQDSISSLSPRRKISTLLLEPFKIHGVKVDNPKAKVKSLLEKVGLSNEHAGKYPHQLSGGQARRVSIARALALEPDILIADEPTAGLDVSVAAGILNLLKDLKEELGLTYIIITHDLNIINYTADRVAVMYLGQFVEMAPAYKLFENPLHPYTEALLSAVSIPDPSLRGTTQRIILEGEIPDPANPPNGCPFNPRCRYSQEICKKEKPQFKAVSDDSEHLTACHFPVIKNS